MLRHATPRRGFSLTEVLVALFVMAVGIISLLTLFPVGAVQMGHALRDDRTQTAALQADAHLRLRWQAVIERLVPPEPYETALDSPADGHANLGRLAYPSYPVLFDPIGHQARGGGVGRNANVLTPTVVLARGFPRRTANALNANYIATFRANTMLDDLEFGRDPAVGQVGYPAGVAETGASAAVVRHGQYNWAAMIQRPNNQVDKVADVKILVFHRRPPGIAPTNAEVCFPNFQFDVGATQLTIPVPLDNLKIRVGSWVMDGTLGAPAGNPAPRLGVTGTLSNGTQFGVGPPLPAPLGAGLTPIQQYGATMRHAHFHRIKTITEVGGNTVVEIDTPIPAPWTEQALPTGTAIRSYNGQLYILDNLVEVFDRPQLAPGSYLPQVP